MNSSMAQGSAWATKIFQNTQVICTEGECEAVIRDIMKSYWHMPRLQQTGEWPFTEDKVVVGADFEGVNLGVDGPMTLIQIATQSGSTYLFDVIACPAMIYSGLKKLLESECIIKIIHDCRNDSIQLYHQYGIKLEAVFDTRAAHIILAHQQTGKQVSNIGFNKLCEHYNAPQNPLKDQFKNVYIYNPRFWSTRPLTTDMIVYAAADVLCLIEGKIYEQMSKAIQPANRMRMVKLCKKQIDVCMVKKPNKTK